MCLRLKISFETSGIMIFVDPMTIMRASHGGKSMLDTIVVSVSGQVGESHVQQLCNLIPGLVNYECKPSSG